MDYRKNIKDNADIYENDKNTSEEKCETRKRKMSQKKGNQIKRDELQTG